MAISTNSAPTVNDDVNRGYVVGQEWEDTSSGTIYKLRDNTAAAAVWDQLVPPLTGSGPLAVPPDSIQAVYRWVTRAESQSLSGPNGSDLDTFGGGTGWVEDSQGYWRRRNTTTATPTTVGAQYTSGSNGLWRVDHGPVLMVWKIKTSDLTLLDSAYQIGCMEKSLTPASTGVWTGKHAMVRHVAGTDSGFVLSTADGVTQETSGTINAIALDTAYWIALRVSTANVQAAIYTVAGGWSAAVTNSTNIPAATDEMRPRAQLANTAATNVNIFFGGLWVQRTI